MEKEREREREKHPVDNQKLSSPSPVGKKGPLEGGLFRAREGFIQQISLLPVGNKQTRERERELNKRKHS